MPETMPDKIGGFTRHGNLYRSPGGVSLCEDDARKVVEMAEAEGAAEVTVLRRLIREGLGRRKGRKGVAS